MEWFRPVYFFIWILFGAIGAAIGQSKGRWEAGFLWGFFLGPLGWIVIAIGPDLRSAIDKGMKTCPSCAEEIKREASKCRFCGSEV